jgi:hypothetical protein
MRGTRTEERNVIMMEKMENTKNEERTLMTMITKKDKNNK